nr:transposase [Pectinatus frisingensis]
MSLNEFTQKDYTMNGGAYQLKFPLNIEYLIPKDESVRLLGQIVEKINLQKLYQPYSRYGKNQANPRQMLKILLYAYMNHIYSARSIERACRRDINFMYLMEGKPAPYHANIARFRSLHVAQLAKEVFTQFDGILADCGELFLENLFIDGTKIEAAANKYTFVWKKATTWNQQKLMDKISAFFAQAEDNFGIHIPHGGAVRMYHLKKTLAEVKIPAGPMQISICDIKISRPMLGMRAKKIICIWKSRIISPTSSLPIMKRVRHNPTVRTLDGVEIWPMMQKPIAAPAITERRSQKSEFVEVRARRAILPKRQCMLVKIAWVAPIKQVVDGKTHQAF